MMTRAGGDPYLSPEAWRAAAPATQGSWWQAWQPWLAQHSGARQKPPRMGSKAFPVLGDAPGTYVMEQ